MTPLRSKPALVVAICLASIAAVVIGRAVIASDAELASARSYRENGELARATEHYRRSLRWSFPASRNAAEASSELEALAREYEQAGDAAGALLAWRSLAGGVAASRFLYSGTDATRELAKDEIARLLALEGGVAIDANLSPDELAADHRRLLDRQVAPDPVWGTLLLFGFALFIGSLLFVIRRGFDRSGQLLWPAARGPVSGALIGLLSFVLGLLFA